MICLIFDQGRKIRNYSQKGIELAKKIIEYLEENEGCAECFPYEIIDKLEDEFIF